LSLTHGHALVDIREEAQLLIRRHNPLILVLPQRVEPCLSLSLLNRADIHERPNIADVEVLTKLSEASHLAAKGPKTLTKGPKLTRTLQPELTQVASDVGHLSCALQTNLTLSSGDVGQLPCATEAQFACRRANPCQLTGSLKTHTALSASDVGKLPCTLQTELTASGADVRQLTCGLQAELTTGRSDIGKLSRAAETQFARRCANVCQLLTTLQANLSTGRSDVRQLTGSTKAQFARRCANVCQLLARLKPKLTTGCSNVRQLTGSTEAQFASRRTNPCQLLARLKPKLTPGGTDVRQLTCAPETQFSCRGSKTCHLPCALKPQLTKRGPKTTKELRRRKTALLLLLKGLLSLTLSLLKPTSPKLGSRSRLLFSNISAKFAFSNSLTAAAKSPCADSLGPDLLFLKASLTSNVGLRLLDDVLNIRAHEVAVGCAGVIRPSGQ